MVPEKQIDEFVQKVRRAAGENLLSVILYGSAAAGTYIAGSSDVNLLFVLRETSFSAIAALSPIVEWWRKQKHRLPLFMTADEMRRSADVFSIEFLDMQRTHKLLWGQDILKTLEIPMRLHRAQLEYELREKTILLRQHLMVVAANDDAKWDLLLNSLSTFGTLFRHALIASGEANTGSKRDAAAQIGMKLKIDTGVFAELLDIRERKKDRKALRVDEAFGRYLKLVEEVTESVDKMLDPAA